MNEEAYYVLVPVVSELTAAKDAAFQLALQNERAFSYQDQTCGKVWERTLSSF